MKTLAEPGPRRVAAVVAALLAALAMVALLPGIAAAAEDGVLCPVAGPVDFSNDFHDPRSGGRRHQGIDVLADLGTPVVAPEGGMVEFGTSRLGGIVAYLTTPSRRYYFAHLDSTAEDLLDTQYVNAGWVIGFVGSTGNASASNPHLHYEIEEDGLVLNPFSELEETCRLPLGSRFGAVVAHLVEKVDD